jgi:hypothetical protein
LPIRGLYAASELASGLFYFNHPDGAGLMSVGFGVRQDSRHIYCALRVLVEAGGDYGV